MRRMKEAFGKQEMLQSRHKKVGRKVALEAKNRNSANHNDKCPLQGEQREQGND
jgi:hypothetical protein